jgi:hypothetical protein
MKPNERARAAIFEIIENQIKDNDPPETKITYDRLKEMGHDDFVVKQYIGQCIAVEYYDMMTKGEPFDKERYVNNLKNLPKEPFE